MLHVFIINICYGIKISFVNRIYYTGNIFISFGFLIEFTVLIRIENKYRFLSNLNQTVNQICKAVKVNSTDIWLRSGNSLHQKKKSLRDSQTQKINYKKK
jgi:hypothetical protein